MDVFGERAALSGELEKAINAGALSEGSVEEIGGVEKDQVGVAGVGESVVEGGAKKEGVVMTGVGDSILTARRGSGSRSPVIGPDWNASWRSDIGSFDPEAFAFEVVLKIGVVLTANNARLMIAAFLSANRAAFAAAIAFG